MCHVDRESIPGRESSPKAEHASGICTTHSNLLLLGIKLAARGKCQKLKGVEIPPVVAISELRIGFSCFRGHFGGSEDRLERVSGHMEYQEEASALDQ